MRRVIWVAVLAWLLGAAGQAWYQDQMETAAQDSRSLMVVAWENRSGDDLTEGEPCASNWSTPAFGQYPNQIVVRNETDMIIAVWNVEGVYQEPSVEDADWTCTATAEIPVPDATFYTVYLNDQRLITYSSDTLPTDPYDALVIPID